MALVEILKKTINRSKQSLSKITNQLYETINGTRYSEIW